jgi:hypothetical protein
MPKGLRLGKASQGVGERRDRARAAIGRGWVENHQARQLLIVAQADFAVVIGQADDGILAGFSASTTCGG